MRVSDQTTKVYSATACVESRSFYYVGLLLVGAVVVRRWERELTEGQGIAVGTGRGDNDRK
jgi:hypothetical protein